MCLFNLPVTQVPPTPPVTCIFLSRNCSTLFCFTVNFLNYPLCQWMQDLDTILNIVPFPKLSFGCAFQWNHQIYTSTGLNILLVLKMKEPLLMSFSYILSKGKNFYLKFRLAKRKENLNALSCATCKGWMSTFSVTSKISQVLKLLFLCVCVCVYCMFFSMGKYLMAYVLLQISGKLLNWHVWHRVKRWKLSSGLTASCYTMHSGRVWANCVSSWNDFLEACHRNRESLRSPGNKATWWLHGLYTPLTVYWKSFLFFG